MLPSAISFSLTSSTSLLAFTNRMASALAAKDQWFVVHVLSGQENKVKDNIEKRVKTDDICYERCFLLGARPDLTLLLYKKR